MDQTVTLDKNAEKTDYLLELAFGDWRDLKEIESWERTDLLDVLVDWPIAEMHLSQLGECAERMTPAQKAQYARLLELVEDNRPILERIREAVTAA